MTAAMVRQQAVTAPTRQPPPGSILDCATVIETPSLWGNYKDGFWSGVGCGKNTILPDPLCGGSGYVAHPNKTFLGPVWTHAHNFAVYRGVACNSVGFDATEADLENAFDAAEGLAVARAISDIYQPTAADASAGYSGGAVSGSAVCAFGSLVGHALQNYGAMATFLLPAGTAVALQAAHVLEANGGSLTAAAGGCVAIAPQLPSMLALGALVILRTPRVTQRVFNPLTNQASLLTERVYQVGVDCDYAAKAPIVVDCAQLP